MKELRVAEVRADQAAASETLTLVGTPIVYNQPTIINDVLGSYTEIIRSGALDSADLSDVRLLYNHDTNKVPLARTPRTMQFSLGAAGLNMVAELPNTEEARSIHTAVARGDLSGMSFAFKVPKGGSQFDAKTNTRTITKIDKVYECSICPFPAYPQTSVEARSEMQDIQTKQAERQALKIKVNQIIKRGIEHGI